MVRAHGHHAVVRPPPGDVTQGSPGVRGGLVLEHLEYWSTGVLEYTVRPTTGLFRTVEPNSPRTVYGLPLYRFDLCYIVYMVRNTIFHHDKVLPLGLLRAYGLPDAP